MLREGVEAEGQLIHRPLDNPTLGEEIYVENRCGRSGIATHEIVIVGLNIKEPNLRAHVVPTSEGQRTGVGPRGRGPIKRSQLTLPVIRELVLVRNLRVFTLDNLHEASEYSVEDLGSPTELLSDIPSHCTCRPRGERQRERLTITVESGDIFQGDHRIVSRVVEEVHRMLSKILIHACDPIAGHLQLRDPHGLTESLQADCTGLSHRVSDRHLHRTPPPPVHTVKDESYRLGAHHPTRGTYHRAKDVRGRIVEPSSTTRVVTRCDG